MQKIELQMQSEEGLHSRPAMEFAKEAAKYSAEINIEKDGMQFDAKSILMVLSACVCQHDTFVLTANGADEAQAVQALAELVSTMK